MSGSIVAFSTSSPQSSVAIFSSSFELLWAGSRYAPEASSGACLELLEVGLGESGSPLSDISLFLADLGPGSFTGVRVGVMLAKTFAFTNDAKTGGASAFDLIDPTGLAFVPSRRREIYIRVPGREDLTVSGEVPVNGNGYGLQIETPMYPEASRFVGLLKNLEIIDPTLLVPKYVAPPSISTPKKPYTAGPA